MDSKTFAQQLAYKLNEDPRRVGSMIDAFAGVLRRSAVSLAPIAVPSFGTFCPTKFDEEVVTDRVTGKRMLLPPQIAVEFKPAAMLRKKLIDNHE